MKVIVFIRILKDLVFLEFENMFTFLKESEIEKTKNLKASIQSLEEFQNK